jgi:hypothetical protein
MHSQTREREKGEGEEGKREGESGGREISDGTNKSVQTRSN